MDALFYNPTFYDLVSSEEGSVGHCEVWEQIIGLGGARAFTLVKATRSIGESTVHPRRSSPLCSFEREASARSPDPDGCVHACGHGCSGSLNWTQQPPLVMAWAQEMPANFRGHSPVLGPVREGVP